jgi:hypothetical protein
MSIAWVLALASTFDDPVPDTVAPTVTIQTPADGGEVSGPLTIVVAASDETALASVSLTIDGAAQGEADVEAPYQFAWDATAAGPGEHLVTAVARDASNNTALAAIRVVVPAPPPPPPPPPPVDDDAPPVEPVDDEVGPNELPGCSLDAGGGSGGAGSILVAAVLVRTRRRRRRA